MITIRVSAPARALPNDFPRYLDEWDQSVDQSQLHHFATLPLLFLGAGPHMPAGVPPRLHGHLGHAGQLVEMHDVADDADLRVTLDG